jgi:hypothetical protein
MQLRRGIPAVVMMSTVLAACGGSGSPAGSVESDPPRNFPQVQLPSAAASVGDDLAVGNYTLVGSELVSGTVFEDTYTADVSNWSGDDATIEATLAPPAAGFSVVDGSVSFGDVQRGATRVGNDTFTIRRDHNQPLDASTLVWSARATPLPATTFELIDRAQASGGIDADTALLYKVFFEFNDNRLPEEYRGRDDGFFEARAIEVARKRFSSLSPAVQMLLALFCERRLSLGVGQSCRRLRRAPTATTTPVCDCSRCSFRARRPPIRVFGRSSSRSAVKTKRASPGPS